MIERLITPEEASEILGVTAKSLSNSRYTGTGLQVPYIKLGKIIRYKKSELEVYIDKNTINHTGQSKEVL
jgi:dimeric dUTPase (all-alpha-NTP-PPase superfamily)